MADLRDSLLQVASHSAAHCPGAAMLEVRTDRGTLVHTGDYKLRPNPITPPSRIPRCDELVMECTFGEPRYVFPADDLLVRQLHAFVDAAFADDATPVVLAYALGKGQEALYHLTGQGYDVVLHGAVASLCRLHVELGYSFPGPGIWTSYKRGEVGRRVLLTTPSTRRTAMAQQLPKKRICYLTGWAPARFAERLRALGLPAEHVGAHPQDLCGDDEGDPVVEMASTPDQHSLDLR